MLCFMCLSALHVLTVLRTYLHLEVVVQLVDVLVLGHGLLGTDAASGVGGHTHLHKHTL